MRFTAPTQGRKSAYYSRNRETLIWATQVVLAKKGPEAKLEEIAAEADMAVSTIYKHFPNRDALAEAAVIAAMEEWEASAFQVSEAVTDPIGQLLSPIRQILDVKKTHPLFGQLAANNREVVTRMVPLIASSFVRHVIRLTETKVLKIEEPELRARNVSACILIAFENQINDPKPNLKRNLLAIAIAMEQLGIDSKTAALYLK